MAIIYTLPATGETVDKEPWTWRAYYTDGTQLEQFEVNQAGAIFHRWAEVDAAKLITLQLVHATYPPITIAFNPEAEPVHFYRNRRVVEEFTDASTGELMHRTSERRLWVIGFRKDKQYWLAYTDEQGHTTYSDSDKLFTEGGN